MSTVTATGVDELCDLPIDELTIGEDVRLDEDAIAFGGLVDSVERFGILQPLTVRRTVTGWEVVAGRRRLAAARAVGLTTVPCIDRELDDADAFDVAIAENLHRRDLSWIEVAHAYRKMTERGDRQLEIAKRVNRSQTHVSQILKLLTIPADLQDRVHRREISYATALDPATRKGSKGGGTDHRKKLSTGNESEVATHWRRRHDRLIAGIQQTIRAKVIDNEDADELCRMLDRLMKLDRQPLPDVAS